MLTVTRQLARRLGARAVSSLRRMPGASTASWIRDRRGVVALEFAFIVPVIVVLSLVGFDLARYAIYVRKVQLTASTMANFIARNDSGTIAWPDIDTVYRSQLVVFPEIMRAARDRNQDVWNTVQSTLSGVQFKASSPCQGACTYTAYVAWTSGQGRPCATPLTAASNTAQPSPSTLPADTFGPGFLIVADVTFDYLPMFMRSVVGRVTIRRSFYLTPRYVPAITYDSSAGGPAWTCRIP